MTAIADGHYVPLSIRATTADDVPFIIDTWKKSLPAAVRRQMAIDREVGNRTPVERLLSRGDVFSIAAYDDAREHPIIGWMAWTPWSPTCVGRAPAIHFIYVRGRERRAGTAMSLLLSPIVELGNRVIYTSPSTPMADIMVGALERRGIGSARVPVYSYLRGM